MKQMNALEERIGVQLLERTNRGVFLTAAAVQFFLGFVQLKGNNFSFFRFDFQKRFNVFFRVCQNGIAHSIHIPFRLCQKIFQTFPHGFA